MNDLDIDPKLIADQQGHTVDVNLNVYTRTSIESRIEAVEFPRIAICKLVNGVIVVYTGETRTASC